MSASAGKPASRQYAGFLDWKSPLEQDFAGSVATVLLSTEADNKRMRRATQFRTFR